MVNNGGMLRNKKSYYTLFIITHSIYTLFEIVFLKYDFD